MTQSPLNKKDIANYLSEHMGWTKKKSLQFVEDFFAWITQQLQKNINIVFSGFGTFKLNKRKSKKVLHPVTKDPIIIPEHYAPQFTPSKTLTSHINKGETI